MSTKTCTYKLSKKCSKVGPSSEFVDSKNICKSCSSILYQSYYEKNKDDILKKNRVHSKKKYRDDHPDMVPKSKRVSGSKASLKLISLRKKIKAERRKAKYHEDNKNARFNRPDLIK
jgi:hypothetical protein